MKKVVSVVLLVVMVLACVSVAACRPVVVVQPPAEEPAPATPEPSPSQPSNGGVTPPSSSGGFTWNDVPAYPGAAQVAKGSWTEPPEEGEMSKVEWRHYQTGDGQDNVVSFYKSAMPGKGWQEMASMEMGELSWLMYTKNNEADLAWVYVGEGDGGTLIHLMRGSE